MKGLIFLKGLKTWKELLLSAAPTSDAESMAQKLAMEDLSVHQIVDCPESILRELGTPLPNCASSLSSPYQG